CLFFFFSSRRRHTRFSRDWSSDVCSSDLEPPPHAPCAPLPPSPHAPCARRPKPTVPSRPPRSLPSRAQQQQQQQLAPFPLQQPRSEERRVGKECSSGWAGAQIEKKKHCSE